MSWCGKIVLHDFPVRLNSEGISIQALIFNTLAKSSDDIDDAESIIKLQRPIQNPVKHLRWDFLRKYLTAFC